MKVLLVCYALLMSTVRGMPHFGYHYERNGAPGGGPGGGFGGFGANAGTSVNVNAAILGGSREISPSFFNPAPNIGNALASTQIQPPNIELSSNSFGGNKYLPPAATTAAPIITKQFFLVSAPDESEAPRTKHLVIGRPQKNYRVVFIKAPTPDNASLKLTAEYAPQEEKTVIYVLSKKGNELNVGEIATPAPTQPTKPEVFFIKYKTPEEAAAAQKEIQDQYDSLGGTSEYSDQGVAPVKSVIGSLDGAAPNGGYDYKRVQNGGQSAIKDFLQQMRYYF